MLELWLWTTRIERDYHVLARYSIRPTKRRGVCRCYVEIWSVAGDNRPHTRLLEAGHERPTANLVGGTTALLTLLSEAEARLDEAIASYRAQQTLLAADQRNHETS
jgi:hypothetical protein